MDYWKRAALGGRSEDDLKRLTDQAPLRVFSARKDAVKKGAENVYQILFYLKNNYSPHTKDRAFIEDILQDDRFSFEKISDYLKPFSKSSIKAENMTLKNKVLLGSWIVTASKVFRHDKMQGRNLPGRYDERMLKECKIKMQPMYNYKNLYKLMRIALKLLNCRFKMTYFVKNHDILFN